MSPSLKAIVERGREDQPQVSEGRLHASFFLFVAGGVALLASAAVLVYAQLFPATFDLSMRFVLRHVGGVVAGLGAVMLFTGLVAALSTRPYMRVLAAVGAVVSLAGVAGFGYAYPWRWGVGADLSVPVIVVLTVGFAVLVAATFAAVVSNLILRQRVRQQLREDLGREPTDEEVARDIEEAMERYRYTWGGVREDTTRGLTIDTEPAEGFVVTNWKLSRDVEDDDLPSALRSTSTLLAFRGLSSKEGELDVGSMDTDAASLVALRQEKASAEANRWTRRLRAWLARRWAQILRALGRAPDEAPTRQAAPGADDAPGPEVEAEAAPDAPTPADEGELFEEADDEEPEPVKLWR